MSARRSPVERDARQFAANALREARRHVALVGGDGSPAFDALTRAGDELMRMTVWAVQRGDMPRARRYARSVELLEQARGRLTARRWRDHQAKMAALGLEDGALARITRGGSEGEEVTIEAIESHAYIRVRDARGNTRRVSWRQLEVVEPPMPHDDEHGRRLRAVPA
ncbi:hypothetical protein [Promicromonospora sp. NPDC050262]|uniref:hypothetical protein n=1 Tax=Promicromonospora sp. NPDC050262 TaxID=3155036 RepID=UPI00340695AD